MAIHRELLEILACPACKTPVDLTPDERSLLCRSCRRRYAIVDDIPIMLVEEATIELGEHPDDPGSSRAER